MGSGALEQAVQEVVDASALQVFKARLDEDLRTCSSGRCSCPGGVLEISDL